MSLADDFNLLRKHFERELARLRAHIIDQDQELDAVKAACAVMRRALVRLTAASCTCHVKSPELQFHAEACSYRIAAEAIHPEVGKEFLEKFGQMRQKIETLHERLMEEAEQQDGYAQGEVLAGNPVKEAGYRYTASGLRIASGIVLDSIEHPFPCPGSA